MRFQPNGAMVGDAANVAGTGVRAERLAAGVGAIGRLQKGDGDNLHARRPYRTAHEKQVDKFPRAVILDGAQTFLVERFRQVAEGGFQAFVHGIGRGVVEIAHRHNIFCTSRLQGVRKLFETVHGDFPPGLGHRRTVVLGGVVVHQEGDGRAVRLHELREQDVPRAQDGGIGPV